MLLPDEWARLETAAQAGPERCGMTSIERRMLHRTAIQIGLLMSCAATAAHPKVVQQVMRQSSILLTSDTCGRLFPGHPTSCQLRVCATRCRVLRRVAKVGPEGVEPPTKGL